jgi:hypothetical protein
MDVFPALVGPIRKNEGREVAESERNTMKCSNNGIVSAMTSVMQIARGVGPSRADSQ